MKHSILLIEDDQFIKDLYETTLDKAGFKVRSAMDGKTGLEMALSGKPDVVLLDVMLPVMNGLEVLKNIRAEEKTETLPIILLTNLAQDSIIAKASKMGIAGYILKVRVLPNELVTLLETFFATGKLPD